MFALILFTALAGHCWWYGRLFRGGYRGNDSVCVTIGTFVIVFVLEQQMVNWSALS